MSENIARMLLNQRNVRVLSSLGPNKLLLENMNGGDSLSSCFKLDVTVLSTDQNIDLSAILGEAITIEMDLPLTPMKRFWNGHVTSFSYIGSTGAYARYHLTLRPWLWLLSLTSSCRIFQNMTAPDIVKQICRERGFTDFREALTGSFRTWEYSVQYRESELNYVSRLLEQEGIYFFFEQTAGKHTLVMTDAPSGHAKTLGYESVPFYPPTDNASRRERDHLSTWTMGRQVRPGAIAYNDYDFTRPRSPLTAKLKAPLKHAHSDFEIYDYPGEYSTSADGERHALIRLEEHQADYEMSQATGNARGLSVGALFSLTDHPRRETNKEYLIVAASYDLNVSGYETGGSDDADFDSRYSCIDARQPFRAACETPKPKIEGPQTATVVGKAGEEIWTDKYGRVKVQFHWDREGKRDENSSCWVRVAQVWAGNGWGGMHIPRIGQEVIVEFLEGDPDRPIITGRVYNGANLPPYELPANQTQSGLKSRSTKGAGVDNFNELRFEDKKGEEKVNFQAEKDLESLVKNDETRTVGRHRTTHVTHNETVTIGGERTKTVEKDEAITVRGNRTDTVKLDEKITVEGNRSDTVFKDERVTIQGMRETSVAKDESLIVQGARNTQVKKDDTVTVAGKRIQRITSDDMTKVGSKLVLDAGDEVVLKTGSASITMKKDGTIIIKGKDISLEGAGKINAKASGDVVIKGAKVTQN